MPTIPVLITALPTPPSTGSPADFDTKADAFLGALPVHTTETNTLSTTNYNNAVDAYNASVTATAQADASTINAALTSADRVQTGLDRISAAASAAIAAEAAAFVDASPVVKGSADPSKQIRFEVDGLTTATTRVLTVPDKSGTVAMTDDITGGTLAGSFTTLNASVGVNMTATNPGLTFNTANFQLYKFGNDLRVYTEGVDRATFNASGLSVHGINFPTTQVPSANANTLDDYEEGTWTPTQGAGLTVTGTFSSVGTYVKVGKQVTVWGRVLGTTSVSVAANAILCSGLPFTSAVNAIGSMVNDNLTQSGTVFAYSGGGIYSTAMSATPALYFTATYTV